MGRKRMIEEFAKSPASITIDEAFQRLHLGADGKEWVHHVRAV
jgi:hypothetical protein